MVEYQTLDDYEGYRIGDNGTVWTRWRPGIGGTGSGSSLTSEWRIRKLKTATRGLPYWLVTLVRNDRIRVEWAVHRLVLFAFVGPPEDGQVARHLNGNCQDSRLVNLAWGSEIENHTDMRRHGTDPCGERNGRSILTEDDVRRIRAMRSAGLQYAQIAEQFPVALRTIRKVCKRRSWAHVE